MYAYKQQIQYNDPQSVPQRAVPSRRMVSKPVCKKIKAKKKKNVLVEFLRFIATISFLSSFAIFILPTSYNSLVKQVFYPTKLNTVISDSNVMGKENPAYSRKIDLLSLAFPINNYLYNLSLYCRRLYFFYEK